MKQIEKLAREWASGACSWDVTYNESVTPEAAFEAGFRKAASMALEIAGEHTGSSCGLVGMGEGEV